MKTFDKKVREIKSRRLLLAGFILIIAFVMLIFWIIEIIPKDIEYGEFKKNEKTSNYAKATVYYLIGPLVQVENPKEKNNMLGYYIAVGEDENLFIVRLNEDNIGISILGKDIDNEAVGTLDGTEIYGSVELASYSLRNVLYECLNTILNTTIVNDDSFDKVLGGYYLDTVVEEKNNSIPLFILFVFFSSMGILYILINKHIRTNVNRSISELKVKGKLQDVIEEFEGGQLIEYKKLKVYLSPKYIFSYYSGLDVIPFKDVKEVTVSKRTVGSRDKNRYIIITTKGNKDYYIAPMQKNSQKVIFNELFTKIKKTIE